MTRRWFPGVVDAVFLLVLACVLIGGRFRLLNDPGTLWHDRLGRDILASGSVPRVDALTFTKAGEPWVDQSWLFDVGLAWLVEHAGWSAVVLLFALVTATVYACLARGLLHDGRSPIIVVLVAILSAGIGAIHFLVRPHMVTLGFVLITLRLCQRQHERGGRAIFWLIPLTALWANLHGGFLAGPLIVFSAAMGHAISGEWNAERRKAIVTFAVTGVLCLVAAVVNPYGFGLYRHVAQLLVTSGVTEMIQEYQPIPFGHPDSRVYEWVLLALVAVPTFVAGRMTRYELIHAAVWLHLSLSSVRNAPLFALAVAPGLARLLDALPVCKTEKTSFRELAEWSIWPGVVAVGLGFGALFGVRYGAFDPRHWPLAGLPSLDAQPAEIPLFHEQDWGGMISAQVAPSRKVFLDDRFELYGKPFLNAYLNALAGGPDWEQIRDKNAIGLVFIRPETGLARRLSDDPAWTTLHRDEVSVLFRCTERPSSLALK
jgi:hypothetical protein